MTHLDLFSGIGGFALAASWAGFTTTQFVEWEPFPQRVLAKNFPGVPIHGDIRTFDATRLQRPSLVTGGFPCQPFSLTGKKRGFDDERDMWPEMARVVGECRPLFVVGENVRGFVHVGLRRTVGDLEALGYAVRPYLLDADAIGAPFEGKRCVIVAASHEQGVAPDWGERALRAVEAQTRGRGVDVRGVPRCDGGEWRAGEPRPYGVADGVPDRLDRLAGLGNAIVPDQLYPILAAIAAQLEVSPS